MKFPKIKVKFGTGGLQRSVESIRIPNMDLFATRENTRLQVFFSPFPGIDTGEKWEGMFAYAYSLITLLPRVLSKIKEDKVRLILITDV